jgi:hypothetical protein
MVSIALTTCLQDVPASPKKLDWGIIEDDDGSYAPR